jgi:hypothetical protein
LEGKALETRAHHTRDFNRFHQLCLEIS